jgi:hypothetical protein
MHGNGGAMDPACWVVASELHIGRLRAMLQLLPSQPQLGRLQALLQLYAST